MDDLRMLARLNEETRVHHADADSDIDRYLFRAHVTVDDYRTYLARIYGFLVPLEASLATSPELDGLLDVRERAKAPLVVHDLMALGMTLDEVNQLRQCGSVPAFRGAASALGWMYVIERPLLASAVLRSHLATYLRAEMAYAASYLSCYAGQVGTKWRELGEAMDRLTATSAEAGVRIVLAAHEAFRALNRYRLHELVPAIRIAV